MEIALARIDDRLIHGQVMTAWMQTIGRCDSILICDDKTARDQFLQMVMRRIAPPGVPVEVLSVEDTIAAFRERSDDRHRVLVLTRGPQAMLELLRAGLRLDSVNLGGMGASPGRKTLHRNVAVSEEELAALAAIRDMGVPVELRMVPRDRAIPLEELTSDD